MRTGFIILAHERLDRAASLAGYLAAAGAAVVIHVDRRVPAAARARLTALPGCVRVISTRRAEWGMFGLVGAALDAMRALDAMAPDLRHVCLLSGACLPIRPVEELDAFLAGHAEADFIENIPVAEAPWVQDGLSEERFTLWFPLSWKRRRRAFDALVEVQRALRVRRSVPAGLEPRLGLQWWCLSMPTLRRLMVDPRLPGWTRYFRHCWIPDECFFQTLVPTLAEGEVRGQPLTLQRFDVDGRPVVFHDDHAALLARSDYFFARKIDPDSPGLYDRFLTPAASAPGTVEFQGHVDEAPFAEARARTAGEGRGVISAARYPAGTGAANVETARPYAVLIAEGGAVLTDLRAALQGAPRGAPPAFHGRLFGAGPAVFSRPGETHPTGLPGAPALRDYRPAQWLAQLVRAESAGMAFLFLPADNALIAGQLLGDPNARLVLCGDGAALLAALRRVTVLPFAHRSWARMVPADTESVGAALASDWTRPDGWTLPEGVA